MVILAKVKRRKMSELEIQQSILKALSKMSVVQQQKLLEFINSMMGLKKNEPQKRILKFAGIFDPNDTKEFESAIKDCERIDENEW